tara:strand:- start:2850 stop:3476 length:627 start_codon:yes stop_codon:yes gene_type:complete
MAFKKGHLLQSDIAKRDNINNWPGYDVSENPQLTEDVIFNNLNLLHKNILAPLGEHFGYEHLLITSGYRCLTLNRHKEIASSDSSHHVYGMAADVIHTGGIPSHTLFNWAYDNLPNGWAQIIWEYPERGPYSNANKECSWVHFAWQKDHNIKKTTLASWNEPLHEAYLKKEGTFRSTKLKQYQSGIGRANPSLLSDIYPEMPISYNQT